MDERAVNRLGDFGHLVAQVVPRERQLREYDQIGSSLPRGRHLVLVQFEVGLKVAQSGRNLSHRHAKGGAKRGTRRWASDVRHGNTRRWDHTFKVARFAFHWTARESGLSSD